MNTKIFLSLIMGMSFGLVSSQVGINVQFPQGEFHVDGAKDNTMTPSPQMQFNDMVVKNDGKVGIGINFPTAKLHIKSTEGDSFRLFDGTEGIGRILLAGNIQGDVYWKDKPSLKISPGEGNGIYTPVNIDLQYAGRKITLEPGRWIIKTNITIVAQTAGSITDGFYASFAWAENNGTGFTLSTDAIFGNNIGGIYAYTYGIAGGTTIINNTSSVSKTYSLVSRTPIFYGSYAPSTNWTDLGGDWGETSIIAFPAN